jgi:hypothetical protein
MSINLNKVLNTWKDIRDKPLTPNMKAIVEATIVELEEFKAITEKTK